MKTSKLIATVKKFESKGHYTRKSVVKVTNAINELFSKELKLFNAGEIVWVDTSIEPDFERFMQMIEDAESMRDAESTTDSKTLLDFLIDSTESIYELTGPRNVLPISETTFEKCVRVERKILDALLNEMKNEKKRRESKARK